ncbi:MAG: hypothetical protein LC713_04325, partial [Actinobacteria bacterium]|nr:hypothetical protein [Actinomycetota bacterium]
LALFAVLALPATSASAQDPAPTPATGGGAEYGAPYAPAQNTVPGDRAKLLPDGSAAAPANAPDPVKQAIWAANTIQTMPYRYGGGHASFVDTAYDCSGTVSVALHGAGLIDQPMDSSDFMTWGERGRGAWITVFTNPGHAYAIIAGLRLDTSGPGDPGPRWRSQPRSAAGFRVRHPLGL